MPSTYLSKSSYGTPTSTKIFTWSCWFKIGQSQGKGRIFDFYSAPFSYGNGIFFTTGGELGISGGDPNNARRITSRKFRDPNAWYHVVGVFDSPNSTAEDRLRLYINGVRETSFSASVDMNQNHDYQAFRSDVGGIGTYYDKSTSSEFFDGEMAHIHFIDGTVYDADTFGETDATTGIWKPKTAPSVTYGTNGFFLKFENSAAFGTDSSGNSNTFTVNGTMTQTIDTPSNVFSTLNPLSKSNATLTNGNTTGALTTNTDRFIPASTLKVSQGKWYAEFKLNSLTSHTGVGITGDEGKASNNNNAIGKETNSYAYVSTDGNFYDADSGSSYGNTYTANDIIGVALDLDNNYIYFSKNGTWQNSGDPTSGATGTGGEAITDPASVPDGVYAMGVGSHSTGGVCNWSANFGNGYFGTTKITSPYNDSNGIGLFNYEPPTNFLSLCTKSLNEQEYD